MKYLLTCFSFLSVFNFLFAQNINTENINRFSDKLGLGFQVGATIAETDYSGFNLDYYGKTFAEYYFRTNTKSSFGLKFLLGGGYISGDDQLQNPRIIRTKLGFIGGEMIYLFSLENKFFPYVSAGVSYLWFNPLGENGIELPNNAAGVYSSNEINFTGELGLKYSLTENLTVNFSTGIQISPNDYLDDKALGTNNDYFFTVGAGLTYLFTSSSNTDSDNDGVNDDEDLCPDTPKGVTVDNFGCPLDSDKDGIPDYKDQCPDTPKDVEVDLKGCPLNSDGDDVPDYQDLCPDTPRGVEVDQFGCPYDHDTDGVPDYLDECPDTPLNTEVDDKGCPKDSDLDGVPNNLDLCPDTPAGEKVDKNGCVEKKKEVIKEPEIIKEKEMPEKTVSIPVKTERSEDIEELTLSSGEAFNSGSAKLLTPALDKLTALVKVMKKYPLSRWKIEGYTDNEGSYQLNKRLSLSRAKAVLNFFVKNGIPQVRFKVFGFGPDNPIADNSTEEGRAKNRRVRIIRIK